MMSPTASERRREQHIRSKRSLKLEEARLDALLRLSQMSEAPPTEIAGFTLEHAISLTRSKIGFVGLLSEDESIYTLHAVSRDVVKECDVAGDPLQWHVVNAGIWADAIRDRKTLFVNDYTLPHPHKKGLPPGHPLVDRFMVVPILESRRLVAVAGVGNKARAYDAADERQVALLLSGMCACMQRSRFREELSDRAARLRVLAGELTLTEQRERRRIAMILHDHIQQLLVAAKLRLEILRRHGDPSVQQAAEEVQRLLGESILASRLLTAELSPPVLSEAGLKAGLEWLVRWMDDKHGLAVELTTEQDPLPLAEDVRALLFESVRELLFNVVKHSHVGSVTVTMRRVGAHVRVSVADCGVGFDPAAIRPADQAGGGFGLFSIRERLDLVGGRFEVESAPGRGTRVVLTAPLSAPSP
jgi:signal transduction histidine kinase